METKLFCGTITVQWGEKYLEQLSAVFKNLFFWFIQMIASILTLLYL